MRVPARRLAALVAALIATLVAVPGVAAAAPAPPTPSPPPNPSDRQLDASKRDVARAAGQVGQLTTRLAGVQARADRLGAHLEARQEAANKALVDLDAARAAERLALRRVEVTHAQVSAAAATTERAQRRLDQFIAVVYERGVEAGSMGLLMEAADPEDLVLRAELTAAVAERQRAALDGLRRAQIARVNSDSLARAARDEAESKRRAAGRAKETADAEVASARAAVAAGLAELHRVEARRAELEHQLDALTARDAGLRAQRQGYLRYQARLAAARRAAAAAAAGRVTSGGHGGVSSVIDRALSQVGVSYAWGGGNARGPTKGIRDGGVADSFGDFHETGFDCSGLMIYAFGAAGVGLPHYSGYQYNAGKKVPVSAIRPGDMLFWAEDGVIHHVALYIGDGQMVEAPYSGGKVRITPVRYGAGLLPYASRLLPG